MLFRISNASLPIKSHAPYALSYEKSFTRSLLIPFLPKQMHLNVREIFSILYPIMSICRILKCIFHPSLHFYVSHMWILSSTTPKSFHLLPALNPEPQVVCSLSIPELLVGVWLDLPPIMLIRYYYSLWVPYLAWGPFLYSLQWLFQTSFIILKLLISLIL